MTPDRPSQAHWYGLLLVSLIRPIFLSALAGRYQRPFRTASVLLVSIFGLGLNFFITATSPWLWLLLVSRLFGGAFGAAFTVAGPYVADVTSKEKEAGASDSLVRCLGLALFAGHLGGFLSHYGLRLPYFAAAGFFLNWLYGFFVLPESLPRGSAIGDRFC